MALDKEFLKSEIVSLMTDMLQREDTSVEEFATRFSDAVDAYVKEADIVYTTGLTSATGGVVTGIFEGQLQ